jgi:hypothetical protein
VKPLGIVVSTIGRRDALFRLLASLGPERHRVAVAVAVQGGHESLLDDLRQEGARLGLDLVAEPSSGGASAGRNDAAAWLGDRCRVLAFPNDTTIYPEGVLRQVIEEVSDGFRAGAMRVDDALGAKFPLPRRGTLLDRRNVWDVILPGLLMDAEVFRSLEGFDPTIGTGAPTPWQSGEETAILLRYLERFGPDFGWLPDVAVLNPHDTAGLGTSARRRKLLGYARGYGRLIRTEGYGPTWFARSIVAGASFGVRHGRPYSPLDGWWVLRGRVEGWFGLVRRSGPTSALEASSSGAVRSHATGKVGRHPNGGA